MEKHDNPQSPFLPPPPTPTFNSVGKIWKEMNRKGIYIEGEREGDFWGSLNVLGGGGGETK